MSAKDPSGDELLRILGALASPHRLRILAALAGERNYVSRLARELHISRPLLNMHLQRLEAAGLVTGTLELAEDGKANKYFQIVPFTLHLSPAQIAKAAHTLSDAAAPGREETEA